MFQKKQRRPIVPIGYLSGMRVISVPENLASVVKQTFSDEQRRPLVPSGYLSGLRVISVPEKPAVWFNNVARRAIGDKRTT